MDFQAEIAAFGYLEPLPVGAVTALLPAALIKRRPGTGIIATVVAAAGWVLSPLLGTFGLAAGLAYAVHSGRSRKASKDTLMWAAFILPWIGVVALKEWAAPGSTGPVGEIGKNPVLLGGLCAGILAVGMYLRKRFQPEFDPIRHFPPDMKAEILKRDGNRCNYCGARGDDLGVRLEADHVIPWSKGGRTAPSNGQLLCGPCNGLKADLSDDDARKKFAKLHGYAAGSFPKNWLERLIK